MDTLHVMVVDDEDTIRSVYSQVVAEDGHRVTTAASAEEALALLRKDQAQIVITDINMGGMNGIQLLREVKKINPDIQVIMLTGQTTVDLIIDSLRLGAFDYLIKPVDELDLISSCVNRAAEKIKLNGANLLTPMGLSPSSPSGLARKDEGDDYSNNWLGGEV
jgi:DNA-binding NtrC family response regulator